MCIIPCLMQRALREVDWVWQCRGRGAWWGVGGGEGGYWTHELCPEVSMIKTLWCRTGLLIYCTRTSHDILRRKYIVFFNSYESLNITLWTLYYLIKQGVLGSWLVLKTADSAECRVWYGNMCQYTILSIIEERYIQKRRQRSSLLFGRQNWLNSLSR